MLQDKDTIFIESTDVLHTTCCFMELHKELVFLDSAGRSA